VKETVKGGRTDTDAKEKPPEDEIAVGAKGLAGPLITGKNFGRQAKSKEDRKRSSRGENSQQKARRSAKKRVKRSRQTREAHSN